MIATDVTGIQGIDNDTIAQRLRARASMTQQAGSRVELADLLDVHERVRAVPVLLDLAIDLTLSGMLSSGFNINDATEVLAGNYPALATPIHTAACLSALLTRGCSLQPPPELPIGAECGGRHPDGGMRYRLTNELACGSFGRVYLAQDRQLSGQGPPALVAMKVCWTNGDARGVLSEAVRTRVLQHPNVVSVLDVGSINDQIGYICMEYVGEGTLGLDESRQVGDVVDIAIQVLAGLSAAHASGIIHGDIKPANVLLSANGTDDTRLTPKLSDFGSGRASIETVEAEPDGIGTVAFMSPEVWRGESPSTASDIFSAGAMLRYLLGGCPQIGEERTSETQNSEAPSRIPHRLLAIINRATMQAPAERYGSASEFSQALVAWRQGDSVPGVDGITARTALRCRRHPAITTAIALTTLTAAVGLATAQRAREGFAYREGQQAAASTVIEWYQRAAPAFSNRVSVHDLASRYVLLQSNESVDAFAWAAIDEGSLDMHIAAVRSSLNTQTSTLDSILLREHLVFNMLRSRIMYDDLAHLIDEQEQALHDAGLLSPIESEQLALLRAIHDVKAAARPDAPTGVETLESAFDVIHTFLSDPAMHESTRLSSTARRDPRVRLASRALHWLSSPKMLDRPDVFEWISAEYKATR
ncbi:MAG: serine/threonine-protein kinase [Planctomycetota bacterium]